MSAIYDVQRCERDVIDAVIAGTDLAAARTALVNAIAKRDALLSAPDPQTPQTPRGET